MKILLISNRYPPDLKVSARRWGNLVSELKNNSIECRIISTSCCKYEETLGPSDEKIIRIPILSPKIPSEFTTANSTTKNISKRLKKLKISPLLPPILANKLALQWLDIFFSQPKIRSLASNCDQIIASYGPIGPLLLGILLSKRFKKHLIIDIRDSFESRDRNACSIAKTTSRKIERLLLSQALFRLTVSKTLARYLEKVYDLSFIPIYNGWSESDILKNFKYEQKSKEPYLYYAGSIYSHQIDAFKILLNSLKYFDNISLKIRLLNDFTNKELKSIVDEEKKYINIEILPATNIENVKKEIADSIGVIVLEAVGTKLDYRAGTVTGKLLGLLVSGKPGIAISSKHGEIKSIVERAEGWYWVDSIEKCRKALAYIKNIKSKTDNSKIMDKYSVEFQAGELIRTLYGAQK